MPRDGRRRWLRAAWNVNTHVSPAVREEALFWLTAVDRLKDMPIAPTAVPARLLSLVAADTSATQKKTPLRDILCVS